MNIAPVGHTPQPHRARPVAETDQAAAPPPSAPAPPREDSVASLLASERIAGLLTGLDQRRPVQDPEVIAELARAAISATEINDFVRALERARALAAMDPERAEALVEDPAMASVREQLSQVLRELTAEARADADQKLNSAHQVLDSSDKDPSERSDLQAVLSVAVQLFDTARFVNYRRAADLAEIVMTQCGCTPAGVPIWAPAPRRSRRIGLFTSVFVWLALGTASAVFRMPAMVWAIWVAGCLVLGVIFRKTRRSGRGHSKRDVMIKAAD